MELPPPNVDVAVLMLFFNRPETFQLVFNEVKKARPSRLFLYQDGPRSERDLPGIEACRKIAEDIDWQCDVQRCYQERNYGCDPSGYMSHQWAFSMADKCIVLEDDVVPSQSFFPFCKELLDRYECDPRVTMIAGFNEQEVSPDVPDDYFFTSVFAIWGWASWRRVVSQWDGNYSFMDDKYTMRQLENVVKERRYRSDFMKMLADHRASGKQYFESIFWSHMLLNNGLAIMPTRNLINNVGATAESTHYSALQTMPSGLRRIFTMKRHELQFPLQHPKHVIEHMEYKNALYRINGWGHPWVKLWRSIEELWLNLRHAKFGNIGSAVGRRIRKWTGRDRHV